MTDLETLARSVAATIKAHCDRRIEWRQIEPAVAWSKQSADELFALAAQL